MADSNTYLGTAHKYFSLSDYEIDPQCRYRKRIFHEGSPVRTKDECVRHPHPTQLLDYIIHYSTRTVQVKHVARPPESPPAREHIQRDTQKKRRRESSVDNSGYATDSSYAEVPPMSPYSSTTSVYDGIDEIDGQSDTSGLSDSDRAHLSPTPARLEPKGKEPMVISPSTKLPISVRTLPKISPVLPKLSSVTTSVSSSITQYSNSRLAERARIATLSAETQSPVADHGNASPGATSSSRGYSPYPYPPSVGREAVEVGHRKDRSPSVYADEYHATDNMFAGRIRRATITGAAIDAKYAAPNYMPKQNSIVGSGSSRSSRPPPVDEHRLGRTTVSPADSEDVKVERTTSPPLDLNAPERPYAAMRATETERNNTLSAPPDGEFTRSRKRSKSSADGEPLTTPPEGLDLSQLRRRGDRGTPNPVLKMALESGDYIQVAENGFYCRVHGDHLGGTRSVTRHHESVHLNIMVECQYCNAQFSRRDAVLRHQRQSSCRTNAKWKVGSS